jgi:hypothetical protein
MATRAFDRLPGNFAIMALPAKLSIYNLLHINVVGTRLHFEDR